MEEGTIFQGSIRHPIGGCPTSSYQAVDRRIEGSWGRRVVVLSNVSAISDDPPFPFSCSTRKTWFIDRRSVVRFSSVFVSIVPIINLADPGPRRLSSASQFYGKRRRGRGAFDSSRGAENRSGGDRNGTLIICPPRLVGISLVFIERAECRGPLPFPAMSTRPR